mmetsp:Transcript_14134/g.20183  ORF Transcript_14134/g.20183 Transcript_14134/m.20183 type:complete len:398 (-) Transcript_14134:193-1386(-)
MNLNSNSVVNETSNDNEIVTSAFKKGQDDTVHAILMEVENLSAKRKSDGFSELNFSFGVLNILLVTHVFGSYPQHFWVLYIVEALIFMPRNFMYRLNARPLCEVLYYLDYCWIMNFSGLLILLLMILGYALPYIDQLLSVSLREQLFICFCGICCGPLLGATLVLPFCAILFHDMKTMTGTFIHIFPPLLFYILRWNANAVHEAWPSIWKINQDEFQKDLLFFPSDWTSLFKGGNIFGNTLFVYIIWWISYSLWQLVSGLDLPRNKTGPIIYDTVFHSTIRNGLCIAIGKVLWKRPTKVSLEQSKNNDFETRDFFVYMMMHAIAILSSILIVGYPCFHYKTIHASTLLLAVYLCIHRGSKRYTYYTTQMYGNTIRKMFQNNISLRESYIHAVNAKRE